MRLSIVLILIFTAVAGIEPLLSAGAQQTGAQAELVVAADGSGRYKTVQEAIAAAPTGARANPVVIRIKPGVYKELIYVQRESDLYD